MPDLSDRELEYEDPCAYWVAYTREGRQIMARDTELTRNAIAPLQLGRLGYLHPYIPLQISEWGSHKARQCKPENVVSEAEFLREIRDGASAYHAEELDDEGPG